MVFGQDPVQYLEKIGAELEDPVRLGTPARISNDTLVRINHEAYFFAGEETRRTFASEPWRWCGKVTDPVTLERFAPEEESPALPFEGRQFYFASDSTLTIFAENPALYAMARNRMAPPDSAVAPDVGTPARGVSTGGPSAAAEGP